MLMPKSSKYKKMPKPLNGKALNEVKSISVYKGYYGIKVLDNGRISSTEIDSVKKLIKKRLKKTSKIYLVGFPDHFSTSKPLEVRMGKGKGTLKDWLMLVKRGVIVFELSAVGINKLEMVKVLKEACLRISLRTKIVRYTV